MKFSNLHRHEIVKELITGYFDVLIIGGGITGAGIALDAQTRGMKTALIEMQDFAAGTSSRSTKLVHGGLRYLKQLELKIVAEVGRERMIVYENGPHVTTPVWMLLPIHKGGTFGKFSTSIGLKVYDFLAGVKKSEQRTMLTADETIAKEPLIKKPGLKGSGYYVEYRTDDARLTIEVLKMAVENGAIALNYAKGIKLLFEKGKVAGMQIKDGLTGEKYEIRANKIINATGPWVDTIRDMDHSKSGKTLKLSKGVHLVIDQSRFPLRQAVYFDTTDGRMVFAIPRDGKTYVGTTDTFFHDDIASPYMTAGDRDYLINAINDMFPEVGISINDVESSWAGVRPLICEEGKRASEISRKDEIWESATGLITIAGGKLTGYRKMAETVTDLVAAKFQAEAGKYFPPCQTKKIPISGGDVGGSLDFPSYVSNQIKKGMVIGLSQKETEKLTKIYGSNINHLFGLLAANKKNAIKYRLPLDLFAQLIYAIEYEMTVTPLDFFYRRTGALLFQINLVKQYKKPVISYMAGCFNWTNEQMETFSRELDEALEKCVVPV
ncbi:glycerol-3-phosphate dehydrogenase/oxidase [Pseudoneobacillus sp. C159]